MEELANVPFLILGNKIDLPSAVNEDHLRQAFGLTQTTGQVRFFHICFCSCVLTAPLFFLRVMLP